MSEDFIYLDHAAATPVDRKVQAAMEPYLSDDFFNPSSPYAPAVRVRREYEAAKASIGRSIGSGGDDIIITAGATESINLAFRGVGGHIVTTAIEHHAVLETAKIFEHTLVPVSEKGLVSAEEIKNAIRPDTRIVSVALANNEIGSIQPLRSISEIVKEERLRRSEAGEDTPIYLHSDASQGVGQVDIHVARLGVDMLTMNAAKAYGPKQVGLLWTGSHVRLNEVVSGGGQERGLRSGTENVAGTVGFAKALEMAVEHRDYESRRLLKLRDDMQKKLLDAFPGAIVSGHQKSRLAGHLHISFPGVDAERVLFMLESKGVYVATGSACAANKGTRSHVLTAIGLEPGVADGSIRMTFGKLSSEENCARAVELITEAVTKEKLRVGI